MSEQYSRSIRSRSPSPVSQVSDLNIEDEYVSKYRDPETGVTHFIFSFDDGQSIAPSSSSGEIDYETEIETADENGLKEKNTEANSDKIPPAYTACKDPKDKEVTIMRECGCPCTCRTDKPRVDRMIYVGIIVLLLGVMVIAADMKIQSTPPAGLATEGGWENNSRSRTYFGVCGADMDPCCFDKESFVRNFREMGVQGIKLGFSKAVGCWRHIQSAK